MSAPEYYMIPTHGKLHIQPWDISVELGHSYPRGAALKYLLRAGNKPGNRAVDDLRKAIRSIEREIEAIEAAARQPMEAAGKSFHEALDEHLAARVAKVLKPKNPKKGGK